MNENEAMELAKCVYSDLCDVIKARGWKYNEIEEHLAVSFGLVGDDLPMDFLIIVDAERSLIRMMSGIPFTVPEDKRAELAIATCHATNMLADGSFDFDIVKGLIAFRLTASFKESRIGRDLFDYMIDCSATIVDEFNDKFLALAKGYTSLDDFLSGK